MDLCEKLLLAQTSGILEPRRMKDAHTLRPDPIQA